VDGWGSRDGCLVCLHLHGRVVNAITIMTYLGTIVKAGAPILHDTICFGVDIDMGNSVLLENPSPFVH